MSELSYMQKRSCFWRISRKLCAFFTLQLKRSILKVELKRTVIKTVYFNKGSRIRLFNLDLHSSVIEDISKGLMSLTEGVELVRWSISGRNRIGRRFLDIPDPVRFVNNQNWLDLSDEKIENFNENYGRFLKQFDGFIVTHTPSFVQIFQSYNKPILMINSTRYEAPYSNNYTSWRKLNDSLVELTRSNTLTAVSNNEGDREYLYQRTLIDSDVVPSVCDYIDRVDISTSNEILVFARSKDLQQKIIASSVLNLQPSYDSFIPYSRICSARAILVIPQNISTMMLFELATLGIPVIIPSRSLIYSLIRDGYTVLSELSYFQVYGLSTNDLKSSDLNNYNSQDFYKNWLKYADFYNPELMPNVVVIDDFTELVDLDFHRIRRSINTDLRNSSLISGRRDLLRKFLAKV